ncbi:hypothetical protein QAD02_002576 [Eretmocerus hayati]|uniref:Uncharacterized protein n=1 Tax=Eretmocerus hayati TaxID=131215 RepID=A0ACC2NJP2_9HYME|nr:hypothetical protein QAD02_002576 [Eretmocerus hayati]
MSRLADGKCVPYIIDDDPDIVDYDIYGEPRFASTVLDDFVLDLDALKNSGLGDRPGITRPTYNISPYGSFSSAHTEDGNAASGNYLQFVAPRAWLYIRPDHYPLLNNKIIGFIKTCEDEGIEEYWKLGCNHPLHHKMLIISPAQPRKWGIPFEVTFQHPGDFMYVGNWWFTL